MRARGPFPTPATKRIPLITLTNRCGINVTLQRLHTPSVLLPSDPYLSAPCASDLPVFRGARGLFPNGRLKNSSRTVLAAPLTPAIEFHCGQSARIMKLLHVFGLSPVPAGPFFAPTAEPSPALRIVLLRKPLRRHTPCFGPAPVPYAGPFFAPASHNS